MSPTFQAHLEILPEAQWRLWPELRPTLQLGFVLYGGTAIALRLGHRSSVDFNFFTEQLLDRIAIHTAFPFLDRSLVLQYLSILPERRSSWRPLSLLYHQNFSTVEKLAFSWSKWLTLSL